MKDLIILSGAPGSGKTTIAKSLKTRLASPHIDLGWLRQWHLKPDWSNANAPEEAMAFENLIQILRNYLSHGYKNIIVSDLQDERIQQFPSLFPDNNIAIFSLILTSDDELSRRVLSERDSGFKDVATATEWNRKLRERPQLPCEHKLDNTQTNLEQMTDQIVRLLSLA